MLDLLNFIRFFHLQSFVLYSMALTVCGEFHSFTNWLNVSEVNCVPLSDTKICGSPYLAKSDLRTSTIRSLDVVDS